MTHAPDLFFFWFSRCSFWFFCFSTFFLPQHVWHSSHCSLVLLLCCLFFPMCSTSRDAVCQSMINQFIVLYGFSPSTVSIAPGRVNLIGEHIDHQGYSVLPVALNQTVQVAAGVFTTADQLSKSSSLIRQKCNEPLITLNHVRSQKFETVVFETLSDVQISDNHSWANYIVAAFIGVINFKSDQHHRTIINDNSKSRSPPMMMIDEDSWLLPAAGIQLLVNGDIPEVC